MDLTKLANILLIASEGSITAAAEKLYISPQALGKSLRKTEDEFGNKFFIRGSKSFKLSKFGEEFVHEAEIVLAAYKKMEERLGVSVKKLRFAFTHGLLGAKEFAFLNRLPAIFKDLEIEMEELPGLMLEEAMRAGKIDIGLAVLPKNESDDFVSRKLLAYKILTVTKQGHKINEKKNVFLSDVLKYKILTKDKNYSINRAVEEEAKKQGLKPKYGLSSPDGILWETMVKQGKGIGIGLEFLADDAAKKGCALKEICDEGLSWTVYLIKKSGAELSPAAEKVEKYIINQFR